MSVTGTLFGLLEARLQTVDRVVLGGLVEGTWPPETRTDPWLSRPMRQELGLDLRGMTVSVQKEMSKDAPRRIVSLPSEVHIPLPPDSQHRKVLEETALNCPVHKSLPPEIHRPTKFFWEG